MSRVIAVFKTKLDLGKINYLGNGKKSGPTDVEMELTLRANSEGYEYWEFSAIGNIWNHLGTNIYHAGQCLDTIDEFKHGNKAFRTVFGWWKKYHLNGMHAGTVAQEEALDEFRKTHPEHNYNVECNYLKHIGLYAVPFFGHTISKKYN